MINTEWTLIFDFFEKRVLTAKDPTVHALSLTGTHQGLWRFRVGDYRVVTRIHNHEMVVVAIDVGHRKEIYT